MRAFKLRLSLVLPVLTLFGASAMADDGTIAVVHDSAKDAVYDCAKPATEVAARARAAELGVADWDKNKLACAADIWFSLSNAAPHDQDTALRALLATSAYINHINVFWDYDLYGIHGPEWLARVGHATEQGKILESRLTGSPSDNAEVLAVRALYMLAWSAHYADTKTQLAESRTAMTLLDRAVAIDPRIEGGRALRELGRLYYDLPEFAGGDTEKGRQLLDEAYRISPKDPALLRFSAYVDVQEGNVSAAKSKLTELLSVEARSGSQQLLADETKGGQDLAARLADTALEQQLAEKRAKLLKEHPQLLRRLPSASNMHGGVDPITGKEY